MISAIAVLLLVALSRLVELFISARNTRRLMAEGATEVGASHYPFIVAVHAAWLIALLAWILIFPQPISIVWLTAYAGVQVFRVWVLASLGRYWTTRIIVPHRVPLIRRGPYRFLRHPNYVVVVFEIALLPLVIGAWPIAVVFSVLNAAVLWVRIKAENRSFELRSS
jgi:methyltransferase